MKAPTAPTIFAYILFVSVSLNAVADITNNNGVKNITISNIGVQGVIGKANLKKREMKTDSSPFKYKFSDTANMNNRRAKTRTVWYRKRRCHCSKQYHRRRYHCGCTSPHHGGGKKRRHPGYYFNPKRTGVSRFPSFDDWYDNHDDHWKHNNNWHPHRMPARKGSNRSKGSLIDGDWHTRPTSPSSKGKKRPSGFGSSKGATKDDDWHTIPTSPSSKGKKRPSGSGSSKGATKDDDWHTRPTSPSSKGKVERPNPPVPVRKGGGVRPTVSPKSSSKTKGKGKASVLDDPKSKKGSRKSSRKGSRKESDRDDKRSRSKCKQNKNRSEKKSSFKRSVDDWYHLEDNHRKMSVSKNNSFLKTYRDQW